MVLPLIVRTTSPGRWAPPSGMFSARAATATTLTGAFERTSESMAPMVEAAPDMSDFISHMPLPGLIEMPPESNVIPLPTRASGAPLPPRYSITMIRGGRAEPCPTPAIEPMPSLRMAASSSTSMRTSAWPAKASRTRATNTSG